MLSALSRGSSKVRQSYICSSCSCNILAHANPQNSRRPVDRTTRATSTPFSTSKANLQVDDGELSRSADVLATLVGDNSTSSFQEKTSGKKKGGKKRSGHVTSTPISNSRTTLKALRDSLIAAGEPVPPRPRNPPLSAKKNDGQPDGQPKPKPQPRKAKKSKKRKTPQVATANPINEVIVANTVTDGQGDKSKEELGQKSPATPPKRKKLSGASKLPPSKLHLSDISKAKANTKMRKLSAWHVTSEDGREYTIRRAPSVVQEIESQYRQFLAESPSIKLKLEEDGDVSSIRQGLMKLLESGNLTEDERSAIKPQIAKYHTQRRHMAANSSKSTAQSQDNQIVVNASNSKAQILENQIVRAVRTKDGTLVAVDSLPTVRKPPGPIESIKGGVAEEIKTISADSLHLVPLDKEPLHIPQLSYGLERVLFNPGVYHLQDPRSRVFNFDPYLQTIMPVSEFDFDALKQYITSSRDKNLLSKALAEKKKYTGSTSSMTSALAHFHFLLSQWRKINTANLSKMFPVEFQSFTALQRGPVAIFLRWRNGTYAIDADKQFDTGNILSMLGKSMEKLLTLSKEDFEKYRKTNSDQLSDEARNADEGFHFTGMGDFLMRSQLDAHDSRLPGTGMFDLKTRSVISVRMDTEAYEVGRGYEIRGRHGEWESYEREYYDMIRSAFLKYSLQVRMGRMDGIFVAYHNTERIFGFQYISLPELDYALHGTEDTTIGDSEFKLSVELLNRVLDRATAKYPEQSLRLHFETRDTATPFTYVFAEPVTETEIEKIQNTNKAKIDEFETGVLGLATKDLSPEEQKEQWDNIRASVEESMEQDEADPESVLTSDDVSDSEGLEEDEKELGEILSTTGAEEDIGGSEDELVDQKSDEVHEAADADEPTSMSQLGEQDDTEPFDKQETSLYESTAVEHLEATSESNPAESSDESDSAERQNIVYEDVQAPPTGSRDLLAMTLTIRNKVNGRYVERPENLRAKDKWEVEYALAEIPGPERVASLYRATQMRRRRALTKSKDMKQDAFNNIFIENIKKYIAKGRKWREKQNEIDKKSPKKSLDMLDGKQMDAKDKNVWPSQEANATSPP